MEISCKKNQIFGKEPNKKFETKQCEKEPKKEPKEPNQIFETKRFKKEPDLRCLVSTKPNWQPCPAAPAKWNCWVCVFKDIRRQCFFFLQEIEGILVQFITNEIVFKLLFEIHVQC